MILTCPECGTNYVVKDGAIPAGGRKVRCASCKHSWHQNPEAFEASGEPGEQFGAVDRVVADSPSPDDSGGQGPYGGREQWEGPDSQTAATEADDHFVPAQPIIPEAEEPPYDNPLHQTDENPADPAAGSDERSWEMIDTSPGLREEEMVSEPTPGPVDEEFEPFYPAAEEEEARSRRWPWVLLVILLLAAAAAAFWYLAPASMKQQVGLVQNRSPLEVMSINNSRQALASGNDLFTVSGRIINPTQASQPVPPLRAELLDETKSKVIHSWMISPPVGTLAPNESRAFHSAEMDVPEGGKFLRVRLSTAG